MATIWDLLTPQQSQMLTPMPGAPTLPEGDTPIVTKLKNRKAINKAADVMLDESGDFGLSFKPANSAPPGNYSDQLEEAFYKNLQGREANAANLKQKLAKLEADKPTGLQAVDFKPLLAFADNLNGTRTAQSYEGPSAVKDWEGKVSKLQESINKENNSLSDDQLNYLKTKATEESQDKRFQMSLAAADRQSKRALDGDEDKLRRQYLAHPLYKNMAEVNQAYAGLESNPGKTGPEQQALVYQYTKLLDPGSVVRESEYAQSAANAGKINQARQYLERLQSGKALTDEQVRLMKEVARGLVDSSRKLLDRHNTMFKDLATRKGISPDLVVIDPFYKTKTQAQPPSGAPDFDNMSLEELQKYTGN